jgi:hypothetical protein
MMVVYIAMRLGQTSLRWKQRADGFSNTLRQVVDPTLGGRMCEILVDEDDGINTAKGLLDWKSRRTVWVTVPTVYSKDRWAVRRLAPQELRHAMELPGDKIEGMNVEVLDKVLNGSWQIDGLGGGEFGNHRVRGVRKGTASGLKKKDRNGRFANDKTTQGTPLLQGIWRIVSLGERDLVEKS